MCTCKKKMSHSSVHHCPACQTGYILVEEKHVCCEACLGTEHALMALSSPDACPLCICLPPYKRQRCCAVVEEVGRIFCHVGWAQPASHDHLPSQRRAESALEAETPPLAASRPSVPLFIQSHRPLWVVKAWRMACTWTNPAPQEVGQEAVTGGVVCVCY